jgi:membrane protein DedA with SNARE-associated domain
MEAFLDTISGWVSGLPLPALYSILGLIAFIEGIFPPIPADVIVALGSFIAARRGADFTLTAASIVLGSVIGTMVVYAVARKFGSEWLHMRLKKAGIENLEQRLELMYSRYGLTALFVSRFIPGLRMITPPMAGATRVPPIRTAVVFLLASGIWYGAIAWIAFRVGDDWNAMQKTVKQFARNVGGVAFLAALAFGLIVLLVMRRRAADRVRDAAMHATEKAAEDQAADAENREGE